MTPWISGTWVAQQGHQLDEVRVPLVAGQAPGQADPPAAAKFRIFGAGLLHPRGRRTVTEGKGLPADAAVHRDHPLRIGAGVVVQRVVADVVGHGDHPVAAGHYGAVTADRVVAVHAGHEGGPLPIGQRSHGQAADPGRQTGMYVQDVRALGGQPVAQPGYVTQGAQPFSADRPVQEVAPLARTRSPRGPSAAITVTRCPAAAQILGEFDGDQLRAAQVERDQDLDDVHGLLPGYSEQAQSTRR